MYEHLLVSLDGSATAESVLEHAQALATAFGSTVTLLRATVGMATLIAETGGSESSMGSIGGSLVDPAPLMEAQQDNAAEYLAGVAARLQQLGLNVATEHPEGNPAELIVERARALDVSLILMTTHGRSGLGRVVFGSVADSVLRHANCPVLVVRVGHEPAASDEPATQLNPRL